MRKTSMRILAAMSLVIASSVASAQMTSPAEPVTVDNYNRAQTDVYFAGIVKNGGLGSFRHGRELAAPVQEGIVRPSRDTLYSFAIVDLDAGPVTITLPDAGKRFMAMQVVNEDQYTPAVYYGAGSYHLTKGMVGTRYAIATIRFLVDFSNKEDVRQVRALQDATKFNQERSGAFDVPNWDQASLKKVQDLQPNQYNAYSVNGITAKKGPDGLIAIQFGGCHGKIENCLPITQGWNYTVRLFLPRPDILDGTWKFPEAHPVG
jgi:hypothetical protein